MNESKKKRIKIIELKNERTNTEANNDRTKKTNELTNFRKETSGKFIKIVKTQIFHIICVHKTAVRNTNYQIRKAVRNVLITKPTVGGIVVVRLAVWIFQASRQTIEALLLNRIHSN